MVHPSSTQDRTEYRWLRFNTVLAFLPAFALLLPYGFISARPLPSAGIAAMFFSAAFSTLVLGGGVRFPGLRACCDPLLAASLIAILVPRYVGSVCPFNGYCRILNQASSWIFLSIRHDSWWRKSERLVILATYGTTPMLLNLYVFTHRDHRRRTPNLTKAPRALHVFAALHTIYTKVHISWKMESCPNCHHNMLRVSRSAAGPESGDKDTVRTAVRFYDNDERVSSEFQTSGFNTPRRSEETLASSTRTAGC